MKKKTEQEKYFKRKNLEEIERKKNRNDRWDLVKYIFMALLFAALVVLIFISLAGGFLYFNHLPTPK
jgi:hypothetical protein